MKIFCSIWIIFIPLLPANGQKTTLPPEFRMAPQPKDITLLEGQGLLHDHLNAIRLSRGTKKPSALGPQLSLLYHSEQDSSGVLTLTLLNNSEVPSSEEGYKLVIQNSRVEIFARHEKGIFYGCQTLEQLLEDARDTRSQIPACKIIDYPTLSYRAVQIDVKHHLDHMNYYYDCIDRLAKYKINAIIFEFEDKLRYQRQPLVGAPQSISIDEMAALTRYAADRHIEISPLVQGLGHATFILKNEEYASLREIPDNRWAFCPLEEGTYRVLFDLYLDAIEATPGSRYIHVGGDEIGNIGVCYRCKPTADRLGVFGLNLHWINRVSEFAIQHGRTPILWDDMPLKYAGVYESTYNAEFTESQVKAVWEKGRPILDKGLADFPENCVFMRWDYGMGRNPGNRLALDWYQEHGIETMIATAVQSGPAALLPFDDDGDNPEDRGIVAIQSFIELAAEKEIDGMLATAWDDRSLHFETYWRGFVTAAACSWSPGLQSLAEIETSYFQREFGPDTRQYTSVYKELRRAVSFWTMALMEKGDRLQEENALFKLPGLVHPVPYEATEEPGPPFDYRSLLITLPDKNSPGKWSRKYQERLDMAVREISRYQLTSGIIDQITDKQIRNRYHWQVLKAINDFQVTAAQLLLSLKNADVDDQELRSEAKRQIYESLKNFDTVWKQLNETYSETRFIKYPDNYIPDRYFHFASQREDLSYLIQVEEKLHQSILEWLEL